MNHSIINLFDRTVEINASKVAIADAKSTLTFSQVRNTATSIANHLVERIGEKRNVPIAIYLPKSTELITADLGVMYSCNAFMNLDTSSPVERIQKIIDNIRPAAIITTNNLANNIQKLVLDIPVLNIEEVQSNQELDLTNIYQRISKQIDTDPWSIINTSGSTGVPKGVVLSHRNYMNYTQWAINEFSLNGSEILGVLSPPFFDHFNYEINLMMTKGATLELLDNSLASFPIKLLEEVERREINFIFWVPTIMVNIAKMDLLSKVDLSKIKFVWFAGEVFPTKQFNYWFEKLPNARFVNLYGPTETTVDCTFYEVSNLIDANKTIPIGNACKNTEVFILTDDNRRAKPGEEGELCVRGTSLAMGYYNNPEKTKQAFVQNPFNTNYPEKIYKTGDVVMEDEEGNILYKGRKDGYIKHLGYRIELGEIDHLIVAVMEGVENCCSMYDAERSQIVTVYESQADISISDFRRKLQEVMPKYMIPTRFEKIESMPRNANGKIDRKELTKNIL